MLLLKSSVIWKHVIEAAPMVVLPASGPEDCDQTNRKRANDLAVKARIAKCSVEVVEAESGEFFLVVRENESKIVGFARDLLKRGLIGEPWFLFRRLTTEPLLLEMLDRSRDLSKMTDTGFVLPDGREFQIDIIYYPAQFNTGLLHSKGFDVGEYICNSPEQYSLSKLS